MLENALQESISIQRAAYLDAQLATTGGASGGHLSLTAESAAAIYKGGTFDQSAQEDLSRVSKEATRLVKSVCSGWNSHMQASTDIIDTFSRAEESGGKVARQQMEKFSKIGAQGEAHAVQALILASRPHDYCMASENASQMRRRALAATNGNVDHVIPGRFDRRLSFLASGRNNFGLSIAAENFTDSATTGLLARYAVVYHAAAQRQESAVEAAYQTMLLPIDQLGVHLTCRLITAIRHAYHSLDGSVFNLNRENVLNALVHPEDFYANQTRVIPVFRDPSNTTPEAVESRTHFIDQVLVPRKAVNYDRVPATGMSAAEVLANTYHTNYLVPSKNHNLIGLAQPNQALNGGQRNFTDTINPAVNIQMVAVTFFDPADPNDLTKAETYEFNVSEISSAFGIEAFSGDSRQMNFIFRTNALSLSPKNIFTFDQNGLKNGSATATKNAATRMEALLAPTVTAGVVDYSVARRLELGFGISAELNLQSGTFNFTPTAVELVGYTSADTSNPIVFNDGSAEYTAARNMIKTAKVTGIELYATFDNLNAREFGTKIDSQDLRHYVETNIHPPITAVGAIVNENGIAPDRIQNLQFQAYAIQSGYGIDHMMAHMRKSDLNYRGDVRLSNRPTTSLGITSYNVNTFYRGAVLNMGDVVSASTNLDLVPNVREFISNQVIRWAAEADIESRLQIYRETVYGGQAPQPTILFVIDPVLSPYMFTPGDTRLLGDRYPFVVQATYNKHFRGKIMMFWIDPTNNSQGAPNTLNHGNTLSKAEVVMKLPTWRDGATQLELGLAQCFKHISHMPLGAQLTVTELDKLVSSRVTRQVQIAGVVNVAP